MSSSVTSVKYSYQEHQTVGAGRGVPTPSPAAHSASVAWMSVPVYSFTGPSAVTSAVSPATVRRIDGTARVGSVAAHSRTGDPSPGSSASSPSPWKVPSGTVTPGR